MNEENNFCTYETYSNILSEELDELIEITSLNLKDMTDETQIKIQEDYLNNLIQRKQKLKFEIQRTITPKLYTMKEWKRFSWNIQEALCKKYNIVLIEKTKDGKIIPAKQSLNEFLHQDKKTLAVQVGKVIYHNMNKKNLDKSINLIHKSTDQIHEFTSKIGNEKRGKFF